VKSSSLFKSFIDRELFFTTRGSFMNYQKMNTDTLYNILFLLPALTLFMFIIGIPFARGLGIAFTNWDGFSPVMEWRGFRNFRILFTDAALLKPLGNTLVFTFYTILGVNIVGLLLSLCLVKRFRGSGIFKTLFFMPIVISLVLASFIWSYIFSDVFPSLFKTPGLLGSSKTVIAGLSIICIWRDSGLAMLIYIAALKSIPKELYEAALVDGAGIIRRFRFITVPMIAPAFTITITLWLGWGLRVFDYPMAATGGGPGRSSWTLAIYVYQYAFVYGRAGYGQAAALALFVFVYLISTTATRILRRREVDL
jgi:raffinose/stachyose/melibiose transport system permease protein